jgi:hypothetical protein
MPSDLPVAASIVDIRNRVDFSDINSLVVDTNAWFWLTYTGDFAEDDKPHGSKLVHYPNFISTCLSNNVDLKYTIISLAEIHKLTEVSLYKHYKSWVDNDDITFKNYRYKETAQRQDFLDEYEAMYEQINGMGEHIPTFDNIGEYPDTLLRESKEKLLEIADIIILKSAARLNISDIITDDGDFATVEDITVYTANDKIIEAAKANELLLN